MKLLILTDMHWNKLKWFWYKLSDISFCDIILSLWDNYKEDLEIFKDLNIPKLAVHWNNDLVRKWEKDWLEDYWFQNIHLKTVDIKWIKIWWIEWNMWLLFAESLWDLWNSKMNRFKNELNLINKNLNKSDIIISHFPIYSIHDDVNSWSHKWLKICLDLLNNKKLKYYFYWHLHKSEETNIWNILIKESYRVEIIDINNTFK